MISTVNQTTESTTDSMTGQAITTGSTGQAPTTQSPTVEGGEKLTPKGCGYAPMRVTHWRHTIHYQSASRCFATNEMDGIDGWISALIKYGANKLGKLIVIGLCTYLLLKQAQ